MDPESCMPVPERLPKQKQRWAHQPEAKVEEGQNLQIKEEGENPKIQAVEEGAHLQIQAVDPHKYVNRALARHVVGVIGKQRDKAKRQARHWQTIAQKQKAKICKLEAENKMLVERHEKMSHWIQDLDDAFFLEDKDEDEDAKQKPGESFSQWEQLEDEEFQRHLSANFLPGVPKTFLPLLDLQADPPKPVPKPPVGPPPEYLIRRFYG